MSIENDNAHHVMLAEVYESRFGWAWIGKLATKTPEESRTIARTPKKKFHLPPPERPKTTDIGNPWHWFSDSWHEHRKGRDERGAIRAAERHIRKEQHLALLKNLSPTAWCGLMALGFPVLIPNVWKAIGAHSEKSSTDSEQVNSTLQVELQRGPIDEQILQPHEPSSIEAWRWELAQRAQDQRAAG